MEPGVKPTLSREIAGAFAWWREAGVDYDLGDDPIEWITSEDAQPPSDRAPRQTIPVADMTAIAEEPVRPPLGGDRSVWPTEIEAFAAWWMTAPDLDDGPATTRISPRGKHKPELMILVEQPEREDREELLSGPQGKLANAIVKAFGLSIEDTYFASILPRPDIMPDWADLAARGMADIVARHVALAAPRRLIAFGSNIPSLLGNSLTQTPQNLLEINHEGTTTPLLTERSLEALARPRAKAGFWRRWLEWTGAHSA